jgi:hypothetical protein
MQKVSLKDELKASSKVSSKVDRKNAVRQIAKKLAVMPHHMQ